MSTGEYDLAAFLAKVRQLDQAALLILSVTPSRRDAFARDIARGMARRAVIRHGLRDQLLRVQDELIHWTGADGGGSGLWTAGSPPTDLILSDIRGQAAPGLMDAAAAFLLGNALNARYRQVLLAPWELAVAAAE